jgi:hypothetical protein
MTLIKAHSEASPAASVYHGWTIDGVCWDSATGCVSDHVLCWDLPEFPRHPASEEIARFVHISDVEGVLQKACRKISG